MPPPKAVGEQGNEFQGDVEVHTRNKRKGTLLLRLTDVRAQTGCEKTTGSKKSAELQPLKDNAKIPSKFFLLSVSSKATLHPCVCVLRLKGFFLT